MKRFLGLILHTIIITSIIYIFRHSFTEYKMWIQHPSQYFNQFGMTAIYVLLFLFAVWFIRNEDMEGIKPF